MISTNEGALVCPVGGDRRGRAVQRGALLGNRLYTPMDHDANAATRGLLGTLEHDLGAQHWQSLRTRIALKAREVVLSADPSKL